MAVKVNIKYTNLLLSMFQIYFRGL